MKPKMPDPAPVVEAPTIVEPLGDEKKAPVTPVMPTPDDEELKAARKRKLARDTSRSGRLSTILSDSSETLG